MSMSFDMRGMMLPIKSVYVGMGCAYCQKKPGDIAGMPGDSIRSLSACTGCHHARYCSKTCQAADWKAVGRQTPHKPICKLLKGFRSMHQSTPNPPPDADARADDNNAVLCLLRKYYGALPMLCVAAGVSPDGDQAPAITTAKDFIQGCRVCSVCSKTEYDVPAGEARDWPHCAKCGYGWCCSEEHWEEYQSKGAHTEEVCRTYNRAIACELFKWEHVQNHNETFLIAPVNPLSEPMSTFPRSWDEYFELRCGQYWSLRGRLPPPFFPVGTRELSQPVNCLQAMYRFGIEKFSSLSTLTIHVVGADAAYEWSPSPTCVWEEIMHCLPKCQTMETIFVGPSLETCISPRTEYCPPMDLECCPDCTAKGRKRIITTYAKKWHEYRADEDRYTKPDLIVAFNAGISMEETDGWVETIKLMLEDDIPCLFTMFEETEAKGDHGLLQKLGANILTEKAAVNPFAVDFPTIDANAPDTFFKINGRYLCFKGFQK